MMRPQPLSTLFPYTTLFRSARKPADGRERVTHRLRHIGCVRSEHWRRRRIADRPRAHRSEEHTSELQSPCNLVCRLLLEKKKVKIIRNSVHVEHTASTK